jgi:hypothetical protein
MRYIVIPLVAIAIIIVIVSATFCLSASEIVQLAVAGATLLLAIAAFKSIKEGEKQFVKSKSPVLKIDLKKWNAPSSYQDKDGKEFFSDHIPLIIKNVGFAQAFNIKIACKRVDKIYQVDLGNKLSCFDLEQSENRQIKCSCSELTSDHLEKPIIIETGYIGILENKMKQNFELPIQHEGEYVTAVTTYLDFGV